jgi:hypothetical protein
MLKSIPQRLAAIIALVLLATFMLAPAPASAQSAADMAAFHAFKLTPGYLGKWMAYTRDVTHAPCQAGMFGLILNSGDKDSASRTLDQMARELDARPKAHALMEKHGLSARQLILGTEVLMAARIQDIEQQHPKMARSGGFKSPHLSAANMAFFHQHKTELNQQIRQLMQAAMLHDQNSKACSGH